MRQERERAQMIETERLRLRRQTPEDFEASYALWSDPSVVRYIAPAPSTRQQSWNRILSGIGHWSVMPFGPFAVEGKATNAYAGEIGLYDFRREITPSLDGCPEAGWVLSPAMHGRGFATEGVRALLQWADAALDVPRIVALISEANAASLRVAEKTGFREWCRVTYMEKPVVIMERLTREQHDSR